MRKTALLGLTLCLLLVGGIVWATTYHSITVDGVLSDFAADENTVGDPAGDSNYAPGTTNDLTGLSVTWDATNLYLGFSYAAQGAAVMYLVDTKNGAGVVSLCPTDGYTGAYKANVTGGEFDLMIAAWFANGGAPVTSLNVYALAASSSSALTATTAVKDTVTSGVHTGGAEVAIPWNSLYGLGAGKVPGGLEPRSRGGQALHQPLLDHHAQQGHRLPHRHRGRRQGRGAGHQLVAGAQQGRGGGRDHGPGRPGRGPGRSGPPAS
jgi:hypothetical protein